MEFILTVIIYTNRNPTNPNPVPATTEYCMYLPEMCGSRPHPRMWLQSFWSSVDGCRHASLKSQITCTRWMPIKVPFSHFQ